MRFSKKIKIVRKGKRGVVVQWVWSLCFTRWESSRNLLHNNTHAFNTTLHLHMVRRVYFMLHAFYQKFKKIVRILCSVWSTSNAFSLCQPHAVTTAFTQEKHVPTTFRLSPGLHIFFVPENSKNLWEIIVLFFRIIFPFSPDNASDFLKKCPDS